MCCWASPAIMIIIIKIIVISTAINSNIIIRSITPMIIVNIITIICYNYCYNYFHFSLLSLLLIYIVSLLMMIIVITITSITIIVITLSARPTVCSQGWTTAVQELSAHSLAKACIESSGPCWPVSSTPSRG